VKNGTNASKSVKKHRNTVSEDQEGRGETIADTGSIRMPTAKRNPLREPRNL